MMENNRATMVYLLLLMIYSTDQTGINVTMHKEPTGIDLTVYKECRKKTVEIVVSLHHNITVGTINTSTVEEYISFVLSPECDPVLTVGANSDGVNSLTGALIKLFKECTAKGGKVDTKTERCMKGNSTISTKAILISAHVSYYVTITGSCISVACLTLLLATHFVLEELQTVYGKTIMALSAAFGVFHIVQFIIAVKPRHRYCKLFGMILQWIVLTIFTWKLIASYDLWKTFHKVKLFSSSQVSKKWKRFVITSVLVPTTIVLICVILEFGANIHLGYGSHGHCFLTSKWSFLGVFMIPIMTMIFFSTFFLFMAFRDIKRRMVESKKLRAMAVAERKETQEGQFLLILILRMLILAGAGWLFGILASFVESSFCMYVFLIVINFKGTLLLLVFGINKRTLKLYHKKFSAHGSGDTFHRNVNTTATSTI